MKLFFTSLLSLLFFSLATAQSHYNWNHVGVEDGLSGGTITRITQDSLGFMWLGSSNGLNRFDGNMITVFKPVENDATTISGHYIRDILPHTNGDLFILSDVGFSWYHADLNQFENFFHNADDSTSIAKSALWKLFRDQDGVVWIGGNNWISRFDPESKKFVNYHSKTVHDNRNIQSVLSMVDYQLHFLLLGTNEGLFKFNKQTGELVTLLRDITEPDKGKRLDYVVDLEWGADSILFVCNWDRGLGFFDVRQNKLHIQNYDDPDGLSFSKSSDGYYFPHLNQYWITGNGLGIAILDMNQMKTHSLRPNKNNPRSIINADVHTIFEDQTGGIWLGHDGGGISYSLPLMNRFQTINTESHGEQGFINDYVMNVFSSTWGDIFVSTFDGVFITDPLFNVFKKINYQQNPQLSPALEFIEHEGQLWAATAERGLVLYDKSKQVFKTFSNGEGHNGLQDLRLTSILPGRKNDLWMGGWFHGLTRFDKKTGRFFHMYFDTLKSPNLNPEDLVEFDRLHDIEWDDQGRIWCGTNSVGISVFNPDSGRFTAIFQNKPGDTHSILSNQVYQLFNNGDGTMWAATSKGISIIDMQSLSVIDQITEKDGLTTNIVKWIVKQSDGTYWIATEYGLNHYNRSSNSFNAYFQSSGLLGNQFHVKGMSFFNDSLLVVSGANGFSIGNVNRLKTSTLFPPIYIQDLSVFNHPARIQPDYAVIDYLAALDEKPNPSLSIMSAPVLNLAHDQQVFTLEFGALNFLKSELSKYQYKLEGFDRNWNETIERRFATYTNLNPGFYTFRVRATNTDGIWSPNEATLTINVIPPFWRTVWFQLALTFSILLVLYIGYRWRIRSIEKLNADLEAQVEIRTMELKQTQSQLIHSEKMAGLGQLTEGLSHELNNPLNFITSSIQPVQLYINQLLARLPENTGDEELNEIKTDLTKLLGAIMEGARRSADIVKSLNQFTQFSDRMNPNYRINDELDNTLILLHNRIKFNVEVVREYGQIPPITCYGAEINQVILNVLENALDALNSKGGTIYLKTSHQDQTILVTIRDSGPGIKPEIINRIFEPFFTTKSYRKGSGLGLSVSYQIVQRHRGEITIESEPGNGTTVNLKLPVQMLPDQVENE